MRITLEGTVHDEHKTKVIIEVNNDDLTATALLNLLDDAMVAFGYHQQSVEEAIINYADELASMEKNT